MIYRAGFEGLLPPFRTFGLISETVDIDEILDT